jgi:adenine phosphoribosyltransferase
MQAIDILRLAKWKFTYRELSKMLNLSITVLSRYVQGEVIPSTKIAKRIKERLELEVGLKKTLLEMVNFDEQGYFDNTKIIGNASLLNLAAQDALVKFAGKRVTKVLTAAADGIPLATAIAQAMGVNLAIAKTSKEVGVKTFIEEDYTPSSTGKVVTLYLSKEAIKKNDSVLIVDDVARTGETQRALVNIVRKCKADVVGIYLLVIIGNVKDLQEKLGLPAQCIFASLVVSPDLLPKN